MRKYLTMAVAVSITVICLTISHVAGQQSTGFDQNRMTRWLQRLSNPDIQQRQQQQQQDMMSRVQNQVNNLMQSTSGGAGMNTGSLLDRMSSNVNTVTQNLMNNFNKGPVINTITSNSPGTVTSDQISPFNVIFSGQRSSQGQGNALPETQTPRSRSAFDTSVRQFRLDSVSSGNVNPEPIIFTSQPPQQASGMVVVRRNNTTSRRPLGTAGSFSQQRLSNVPSSTMLNSFGINIPTISGQSGTFWSVGNTGSSGDGGSNTRMVSRRTQPLGFGSNQFSVFLGSSSGQEPASFSVGSGQPFSVRSRELGSESSQRPASSSTSGQTTVSQTPFRTGGLAFGEGRFVNLNGPGIDLSQTTGPQETSGSNLWQFSGSPTSFSGGSTSSSDGNINDAGSPSSRFGNAFGSGFTSGMETTFVSDTFPPNMTTQFDASSFGDTFVRTTVGVTAASQPQPTSPTRSNNIPPDALSCTDEYRARPGHTLCLTDSSGVTSVGVAISDRLFITQFHNDLRSNVQPPAADLMSLQWDDRLAAVAQKWAQQCKLAHDDDRKLPVLGLSVGQNVAVGFESWQEAIQMWYDEISLYRYGYEPDSYLGPEGWRQVAHFTQIVQNGTYLIGCGYAECPSTRYVRYYVCNYASGQSDLAYPYTAGARCEACPNNCNKGLCECNGLVCLNKGKLNPSACKCECPNPYSGEKCEQLNCPASDSFVCGRDWPPTYCTRYNNVPAECPYMCGICGGSGQPGASRPPAPTLNVTTFTSAFGCRYTGVRDNSATCHGYGDGGNDKSMCSSQGGTVGCGDCERYYNIKKDYCPVMCGLCDPPCAGKRCSNGGTLDTTSCACSCRKPFTGDTCEFAQCPVNGDPGYCRFWPARYCQMYYNVPEECPYMCGICKQDGTVSRSGKISPTLAGEAAET
ncbi:uncharacterized protein LOC128203751 [Mya arenaria]|uniref:uncharacterized protein LOC128203751 n=1 Tax=Mya arenaria TaxID=6604 RepID=UPI0022E7F376|nr:uncharacterized protein LOC128203751 [Mya arenaria]